MSKEVGVEMNVFRLFPSMMATGVNPNHMKCAMPLVNRCLLLEQSVKSGGQDWVSSETYNTDGAYDITQDKSFNEINSFVLESVKAFCNDLLNYLDI